MSIGLRYIVLLLATIFTSLHSADGSSITNCTEGIAYNKECDTVCNHSYGKCKAVISPDMCSKIQSQCMSSCYATASERCSNAKKNTDNSSGSHVDNGSYVRAFFGVLIAVGATIMLYLFEKQRYKKSCDEDVGQVIEYQRVIDEEEVSELHSFHFTDHTSQRNRSTEISFNSINAERSCVSANRSEITAGVPSIITDSTSTISDSLMSLKVNPSPFFLRNT